MTPTCRFGVLLLLLGFVLWQALSGNEDQIKKKQSQLEQLRKEIGKYEGKIKDKEKKEHATLELLDTYDRQAGLVRKLIRKLHDEEISLRKDIDETRRSIEELNGQVSSLKSHYAKYISTVYRHGHTYDLELLLSSNSLNQLLIRSEYLKRFSEQRQRDLVSMNTKRTDLGEETSRLENQLASQRDLIAEKTGEEAKLSTQMKRRKLLLVEIRRDKKNYRREIQRKVDAAKDLEQLIAKLIEEDRIKKEREAALEREGKIPAPPRVGIGAFEAKKGQLRWPVAEGKIVARFGNQEHPVLRTITQNTGVDISVPSGTRVEAIADGEVSTISWLPSFGNLIILNHDNGFRTVYAHLSEINVAEGQRLKSGAEIGRSGEALSGPILHVEVWKDREKQDPEQWLSPRGLTRR